MPQFQKELFESQIFGHMKGAFTGASTSFEGYLGRKDVDVVVFDEIGTMPKHVQAKLLVFLDNGEYFKVGSNVPDRSQAKVVGITNERLGEKSKLREDFAFRFQVITVPGLHARRPDVLRLLAQFAPDVAWSSYDLLRILSYDWPGNVREVKRFGLLAQKYYGEMTQRRIFNTNMVDYLTSLRYYEWGLNRPLASGWEGKTPAEAQAFPVPDRNCFDKSSQKRLAEFSPHLAVFPFEERTIRLQTTEESSSQSVSEGDKKPVHGADSEETTADPCEIWHEASFDNEWELWCELYHQDAQYQGDILSCVRRGVVTRPDDGVMDLAYDLEDPEAFDRFFSLRNSLEDTIFTHEDVASCTDPSVDTTARIPADDAIAEVFESVGPPEYKRLWVAHLMEKGAKPADVARRYELNEKTVAQWFRKHRQGGGYSSLYHHK